MSDRMSLRLWEISEHFIYLVVLKGNTVYLILRMNGEICPELWNENSFPENVSGTIFI